MVVSHIKSMEDAKMKTCKTIIATLFLVGLFSSHSTALAQEQNEGTPYWVAASNKIPWAKIDSLRSMVNEYVGPIVEEAKRMGRVLDYKILLHTYGGEYNVVFMTKYPSWEAIGEGPGWAAAYEAIEPNKEIRDAVWAANAWIFEGVPHIDNIYTELKY